MNQTRKPITEETAFLITNAGMDALRMGEVSEMPLEGPTEAGDESEAPAASSVTPEADVFTPDTADKADWVLSKIADHRTRAARIRENMELMAREEDQAANHLEWRYGPALQAFTRQQTESGRKKSVRLPNGVLGYRTKAASVSIGDTKAALEWARVNLPESVLETIDKRAIADALLSTGEAVPFAALNAAEEVFYIK